MMRKTTLLLGMLLMMSAVQAQDFETATEAVKNMAVGWNLGNTLDSNSGDANNMWIEKWTSRTPNDYEKAWGQPVTKPELIKMMKEAGFNAIRVPVTWYPHMEAKLELDGTVWDKENDGMGTLYWMGLSDGEHRSVPEFNQADLKDAIIKGYYGEEGYSGIRELDNWTISPFYNSSDNGQIVNGQIVQWYDLQGHLLTRPTKGVNIVDGRKVIVR